MSDKLKTVDLVKGIDLTRDDGEKVFYPMGMNAMPASDADHWWVQAHVKPAPPPILGDEMFAITLRKAANIKLAEFNAVDAQATEAEEAFAAKSTPAGEEGGTPALRRRPTI